MMERGNFVEKNRNSSWPKATTSSVKHGGGSVEARACTAGNGTGSLVSIDDFFALKHRINVEVYRSTLFAQISAKCNKIHWKTFHQSAGKRSLTYGQSNHVTGGDQTEGRDPITSKSWRGLQWTPGRATPKCLLMSVGDRLKAASDYKGFPTNIEYYDNFNLLVLKLRLVILI